MKIKKVICVLMIIMLLILSIKTESIAADLEINTQVELKPKADTIEENVEIQVDIYIKNENYKIDAIDVLIDYNEDVFYELKQEDFETTMDMYIFEYEEEYKNLKIVMNEAFNEGILATIKLIPKKTITETQKVELLKMYDMYIVTEEAYEEVIPELETSIWTIGEDETSNPTPDPTPDPTPVPSDKLYLSTEQYKIGKNDIKNYEEGDKYISKIEKETTKAQFIEKLNTNGEIRIIKQDGTELNDDELVGTGMTIEVTKDEEKIELQIAVMGDLNGDGKVTATDLSTLNQTIQKLVTLENEYYIAADLDENNNITATDLSTINKMILGLI